MTAKVIDFLRHARKARRDPAPAAAAAAAAVEDGPTPDDSVEDVMTRWPATIRVFLDRGMACPGCVMAPFQSVSAAASSYGIDADRLLAELAAAAARDGEAE